MRPLQNMEVSVSDRKIPLVDVRPSFALGDGVWGFLPFCSRVVGV